MNRDKSLVAGVPNMEDDKKGLPVTGQPENSLSDPVGRRKFLLHSARVGVPAAVVVLSARGAWGGPRLCMSASGAALSSVNNTTASSVSCEETTITLSGVSPGKLASWPGIWPSDLEAGVDADLVKSNGHLVSGCTHAEAVSSLESSASTMAQLIAEFSALGGVATALSRVTSTLPIYEAIADSSERYVSGFERQTIAAALNACGLSDGTPFIYSIAQLDSLISNFMTLGSVPSELLGTLKPELQGSVVDGRSFLQAYFESLWI